MRKFSRNATRLIDTAKPINWQHHLNRGLVADWTITPNSGWRGGATLRDLVRGGHAPNDGVLTGGPTWTGDAGRRGGFGAIQCDANGEGVEAATLAALQLSWPVTIALWLRAIGTPTLFSDQFGVCPNNTDSSPFSSYAICTRESGVLKISGNTGAGFFAVDSTKTTSNLTTWTHIVGVIYGSAGTDIYINGALDTHDTTSRNNPSYGASTLHFLGNHTGFSRNSNCLLDAGMIYNRALSAAEVEALCQETSRGNSERLNWLSNRTYIFPTTVVSVAPAPAVLDITPSFTVPTFGGSFYGGRL